MKSDLVIQRDVKHTLSNEIDKILRIMDGMLLLNQTYKKVTCLSAINYDENLITDINNNIQPTIKMLVNDLQLEEYTEPENMKLLIYSVYLKDILVKVIKAVFGINNDSVINYFNGLNKIITNLNNENKKHINYLKDNISRINVNKDISYINQHLNDNRFVLCNSNVLNNEYTMSDILYKYSANFLSNNTNDDASIIINRIFNSLVKIFKNDSKCVDSIYLKSIDDNLLALGLNNMLQLIYISDSKILPCVLQDYKSTILITNDNDKCDISYHKEISNIDTNLIELLDSDITNENIVGLLHTMSIVTTTTDMAVFKLSLNNDVKFISELVNTMILNDSAIYNKTTLNNIVMLAKYYIILNLANTEAILKNVKEVYESIIILDSLL